MSKIINVIPTPYKYSFTEGASLEIKELVLPIYKSLIIEKALGLFSSRVKLNENGRKVYFRYIEDGDCEADKEFFSDKNAEAEGYIIRTENNSLSVIAKSERGLAYGIVTLIQIAGRNIKTLEIFDKPDFKRRANKWTIWAESGIWSYDFGDGAEAFKKRVVRKLDNCLMYKINTVYFDAFGLSLDRFPGYEEIMKYANDEARARGINLVTGCYGMSYGQQGHLNSYQGKAYLNRTSYPDGEIYECIGTYDPPKGTKQLSLEEKIKTIKGRIHGTCLSNPTLNKMKREEYTEYIKRTHSGGLYMHNMDADEMHPELWLARCDACKRKWPNDDIYATDGAAGAFAEYFNSIMDSINSIKDEGYDAERDFFLTVVSPGYLYAVNSDDKTFRVGMKFWSSVSKLLKHDNISICFREQFFYHDKNERREQILDRLDIKSETLVINFSGSDGFYDDKLFTPTAFFNFMMKKYSSMMLACGNAFQEPLQVYNAEYLWRCENSDFYNLAPKPDNQKDFMQLYMDTIHGKVRPEQIYGDGGFIDIICDKLYGGEVGKIMASITKLTGKNGEPPIPCACSVDIYTNYTKVIYPMRWDNEDINLSDISRMKERFEECAKVTASARDLSSKAIDLATDKDMKDDLIWLNDCFEVGADLCLLLSEYMNIYEPLHMSFINGTPDNSLIDQVKELKVRIKAFREKIASSKRNPIDKLGGSLVRRNEMGEFLDYSTDLMIYSINGGKRIPDERRPLATRNWW